MTEVQLNGKRSQVMTSLYQILHYSWYFLNITYTDIPKCPFVCMPTRCFHWQKYIFYSWHRPQERWMSSFYGNYFSPQSQFNRRGDAYHFVDKVWSSTGPALLFFHVKYLDQMAVMLLMKRYEPYDHHKFKSWLKTIDIIVTLHIAPSRHELHMH